MTENVEIDNMIEVEPEMVQRKNEPKLYRIHSLIIRIGGQRRSNGIFISIGYRTDAWG